MLLRITIHSLLATLAAAALSKRFSYGDTPSGTVDPGVITDCTLWANIQAGDTCSGVYTFFDITLEQFVTYNPVLKSDCSGFTVGHSYCVEENYGRGPAPSTTTTTTTTPQPTSTLPSPTQTGLTKTCNAFYQVQSGDTCQSIVNSYGGAFTLQNFYSWNPAVGSSCASLLSGYYVCVGVPGTPTSKPATTTPSSSGPQPEQSGVTKTCNNYYKVASGDTCQTIVNKFSISSLQQFYSWNPAVGSSCASLLSGYYVCVGVSGTPTPTTTHSSGPTPTQSGIIKTCTKYYQAVSGDTCAIIANSKFRTFTVATFESWNPAVGSACTGLLAGYYYCVAVPGTPTTPISQPTSTSHGPQPQESGTISTCNKYYLVKSGDTCDVIEKDYGITAAQFFSWNKAIGSSCENLYANYYVCVGV